MTVRPPSVSIHSRHAAAATWRASRLLRPCVQHAGTGREGFRKFEVGPKRDLLGMQLNVAPKELAREGTLMHGKLGPCATHYPL